MHVAFKTAVSTENNGTTAPVLTQIASVGIATKFCSLTHHIHTKKKPDNNLRPLTCEIIQWMSCQLQWQPPDGLRLALGFVLLQSKLFSLAVSNIADVLHLNCFFFKLYLLKIHFVSYHSTIMQMFPFGHALWNLLLYNLSFILHVCFIQS